MDIAGQSQGVLIIDDDPTNVMILQMYLKDDYLVFTATDGVEGWNMLQQHKAEISVILLDRIMPNMNGIEFMEKYNTDQSVANIPVIMQTAAIEKKQVAEGLAHGVYYYLIKPYEENVMLTIVREVISTNEEQSSLRLQLQEHQPSTDLTTECYFQAKTLADIRHLSILLANFYPNPRLVVAGISELLINALEHGNFEISYEDKTKLLLKDIWEQELLHRQQLDEHKDKKVLIYLQREAEKITLNIKDEGIGFDWPGYMQLDTDRATHCHGRGIAIANMLSFDSIEYKGCGNEVDCVVLL